MTQQADPAVRALYQNRRYPAMSHPLSDPAVTAVAAALGGLIPAHPSNARIVEIGCASGHNLLPLARRWPASRFAGVDLADGAIATARTLADAAGIRNTEFFAVDLREFDPGPEPIDYIIAHGFFSWVPDEAKLALLEFCQRHLAPTGIATVSFNLHPGWTLRQPVIELVRQLLPVTGGDPVETLKLVGETLDPETPHGRMLGWIVEDMLAKGADILAFDDFGPVNDPCTFPAFLQLAAQAGLRWLGESDPAENLPSSLGGKSRAALNQLAGHPLHAQLAADFASARTFRSGVLCRSDAPVNGSNLGALLPAWSLRSGNRPAADDSAASTALHAALKENAPGTIHAGDLLDSLSGHDTTGIAEAILDGITGGSIRARIEPVVFDPKPPEKPSLNPLALACVRRSLPVVDIWHTPCAFPEAHYPILAAMDGTRTTTDLSVLASAKAPDLAFAPWLAHLAERGFFV